MRDHTPTDVMSASKGSRLLTPGAYTGLKFRWFRPSVSGVTVSVLKSNRTARESESDGVDSLTKHIVGGGATALEPTDAIVCQDNVFTDITFANQNITIFF